MDQQGRRIGAEEQLAVQYAVSRVLAESANLDEASARILQAMGQGLNWDYGALWIVDSRLGVLRCASTWCQRPGIYDELDQANREIVFAPGVGLPGRVWAAGKPAWIPDVLQDTNFPRLQVAGTAGLHAGFGFPILLENKALGVVEFFSRSLLQPERDLLEAMAALGSQIGQFVDRKRGEQALRESEARKAAILRAAPYAIITMDHLGKILEVNPAAERIFGYSSSDMVSRQMAELIVPPWLRDRHKRGMHRYLTSGESAILNRRFETTGMRADGSEFLLEMTITQIDLDGPPIFTGHIRDITDRKQAERQAEQAIQLRDQFLSLAAHELKTPLTSLKGQAELALIRAERQADMDPRTRRALEVINRQANQLNKLIGLLLDVSRIETGQLQIEQTRVDLAALTRKVFEDLRPSLERHVVELLISGSPLMVMGDELRLSQVLQNLIQNAIKYSPEGGPVTVRLRRSDKQAIITVSDQGIGVPAGDMPRLFNRFFRAANVDQFRISGLGVGLYVVKEIVSHHGGTVAVDSQEGKGSTFTVRLPLADEDAAGHEA